MGGEVLELWPERAERLEREAEARGIEQGIQQGLEQGIEQGLEQGIEQGVRQGIEQGVEQGVDVLATKLRELGIDEKMLDEAVSSIKAEHDKH